MSTNELEPLAVTVREAARLTGISTTRLAEFRSQGVGPKYVKTGTSKTSKVLYPYKALVEYIDSLEKNACEGTK